MKHEFNQSMKILFVSRDNPAYGITPFILEQGKSLQKNGIDVEYFVIKGKGINGYLQNIIPLREKIIAGKYDLIHAHYSLSGWVARLATFSLPLVISFMGSDVYGGVDDKGKQQSKINIYLSRALQFVTPSIIVKSPNLMNYIWFQEKTQIVPNGVDLASFETISQEKSRYHLKLDPKKEIVLFFGDPKDPRKNISLVKSALKKIDREEVQLLSPFPIPHDEVVLYLNTANVLVSTSFREGSPNVIKEAMACNCPVVSTNVGDVNWLFAETPGYFLTSFDPSDVASKVLKALDFSKSTGVAGGRKRLIELRLDTDNVAQKIIEIYKSVLE